MMMSEIYEVFFVTRFGRGLNHLKCLFVSLDCIFLLTLSMPKLKG